MGLSLRASASIAGAYNLRGLEWQFALENKSVLYMGYLANSDAFVCRQPLSNIVKSPWDQPIPTLFDAGAGFCPIPTSAYSIFSFRGSYWSIDRNSPHIFVYG